MPDMICQECQNYYDLIDKAQRARDWEEVNRLQAQLDMHIMTMHNYGNDDE